MSTFPRSAEANYTLVVLLVAYVFSFVDRQILSLLVVPIREDLAISDFQISLLQGMAFALFYTFLGIPIGRLADRKNRKLIIASGVFLWSLMTAACGFARSFSALFLARIGVGIGEAALSPAACSILSDAFPPARLARATSIFTMGITIGGGMAYIIGGAVIDLVQVADTTVLPLVGSLKPWQLTFLIVGLPGLLVSLLVLTLREPARQGNALSGACENARDGADESTGSNTQPDTLPLREVTRFILQRRRSYGAIYLGIALLSILGYGTLNWYPTFLIRTYGMSIGEVGTWFGLIYLLFGTIGALGGALCSEHLARRGYRDANLRVIVGVAIVLLVPAVIGPLMPDARLALLIAAPTVFLLNAHFGISIAALQLVTPNQMRALVTALFLLTNNLLGLGLGASFVAGLTDFVFHDDMALRYSLSLVALLVCPLAALAIGKGLKHYRAALDEAAAWQ